MMKEFRQNEEGAITFFVLILSIGLIAMSGLVMDSGRTYSAHSQAQAYMDHIALAMANELDGTSTSITRAKAIGEAAGAFGGSINKSSTLIANKVGDAAVDFQVQSITFLTGQPTTQGSVLRPSAYSSLVTEDPFQATHVLIIGQTASVPWTFLNMTSMVAGLGGESGSDAGAVAQEAAGGGDFTVSTWTTAQLVSEQTQVNEMFAICAPAGWDTLMPGQDLVFDKSRNGVWEEGSYGIVTDLDDNASGDCTAYATDDNGVFDDNRFLVCAAGISDGTRRPSATTVSFVSDVTDGNGDDQYTLYAGLNTRFGIFEGDAAELTQVGSVVPDTNILYKDVYQCNGDIDFNSITHIGGLPTSDCIETGNCVVGGQLTAAEIERYMVRTHDKNNRARPTYFGRTPTTRNELYLAEVLSGETDPDGTQSPLSCWEELGENGDVSVSNSAPTPVANRRNLEIAFVDCSGIQSGTTSLTDVPVLAYADIFLTRPVENRDLTVLTFDDYEHPTAVDDNGDPVIVSINSGDVLSTDERFTGGGSDPSDTESWLWNAGNSSVQGTANVASTRYDRTFNPYAPYGVQIDVYQHPDTNGEGNSDTPWKNSPMVYGEIGGADSDLENDAWGNVLMISTNGNDDNPNDEADGGTIVMRFLPETEGGECGAYVETLRVIDTEHGGTVRLYGEILSDEDIANLPAYGGSWNVIGSPHQPFPGRDGVVGYDETHYRATVTDEDTGQESEVVLAYETSTGNPVIGNEAFLMNAFKAISVERMPTTNQDNYTTSVDIQSDRVCTLLYTMHDDSGGIDDVEFTRSPTPDQSDTVYAEFLNYIEAGDGRMLTYP
ncbi:MAG: Tad domain-containing protein, partial [Pseudomonadota bacterium]